MTINPAGRITASLSPVIRANRPQVVSPILPKPYYRIREVSALIGEPVTTIRFWQAEFKVRDERSRDGQRIFSRQTVLALFAIRDLLRNEGFTIRGAKRRVAAGRAEGGAT